MTQKLFIQKVKTPCINAVNIIGGYLPSVLIGQMCLQTGYGVGYNCEVLMQWNNLLGMKTQLLNDTWKSNYWDGRSATKETPEYYGYHTTITDSFRVYNSIQQCACDYLQFMRDAKYSKNGNYKYRDVLTIKDPTTLITQVSKRGYATDPAYITSVMSIIKKHNLTQYDNQKEVNEPMTLRQALAKLGVNLINRISQNRGQVPAHNANTHQYFAIHYLGVNGQNPDLYGGGYGGHFYISKNGKCYQAAEVTDKLWHVGASSGFSYIHSYARNNNTIGVECGTYTASGRNNDDETWYFTEATQVTAAKLAAAVLTVYNIPLSHLLRHGDITTKNCPSPLKRDQGKGSNWTWDKFKSETEKYIKQLKGTSTFVKPLSLGDNGQEVKTLQENLLLLGFVNCSYYNGQRNFADGSFGQNTLTALKYFQQAKGLQVDGVYGPNTAAALDKEVAEVKKSKLNVTQKQFLENAKLIAQENKKNGFSYGSSACLPSVYSKDKVTSCDRYVNQVLYKSGLKNVGNRAVESLSSYLETTIKAVRINNINQIVPGDIVFLSGHVFIVGNKKDNNNYERYDAGSADRIKLQNQYSKYESQPFIEPISGFKYALRLPFVQQNPTILKQGDEGSFVKTMQQKLIKLGYYIDQAGADGKFGQNTMKAVKHFQTDHNLQVDGICGPLTQTKLDAIYEKVKQYDAPLSHNDLIKWKTCTTTDELNLRNGSSVAHEIITIIPKGDKVRWYGYYTNSWYYVNYKDYVGYVSKHYLTQ